LPGTLAVLGADRHRPALLLPFNSLLWVAPPPEPVSQVSISQVDTRTLQTIASRLLH
jgi:hypothetical protein